MADFEFKLEKRLKNKLGRAGQIITPHGVINTPAFVPVATKATVKALTPEQVKETGAEVVLSNTYHLYLEPGEKTIKKAVGLGKYMHWDKPTMTDSGGFQVFSLGAAFEQNVSKINGSKFKSEKRGEGNSRAALVKISEDGVEFKSPLDGSRHFFTPERSIQIQKDIGADIIFAFDECTSPDAPLKYQTEAMDRTHRWAERSLVEFKKKPGSQALFGIVQGGRSERLRKASAKKIGSMDFHGFGIGGSFEKEDIATAVKWVNERLPEEKPRHLLGIGAPEDVILAIENGCDTFDCVAPTRMGRNGTLYCGKGRINILNAGFRNDPKPIEEDCDCYACRNYSRAYVSHLFRSKEMLAGTLASIHNLRYLIRLVERCREAILDGSFEKFKKSWFK